MCVHLIYAGHEDITPALLLQAEKHYNIKPSSLWENYFWCYVVYTFQIISYVPLGEDADGIFDSMEYSYQSDQRAPVTEKHNLLWFTIVYVRKYDSNKFSLQINWLRKC